jgi:hypothetical protein
MLKHHIQTEYECGYCNRQYKRKMNYDKHMLLCNIIRKTPSERLNEQEQDHLPTMRELYTVIQTLVERQEKFEKQIEKMSSWINNNRKKINVLDWLNTNHTNSIDFNKWLNELNISEEDMELVFKHGFIEGMKYIINHICLNDTNDNAREEWLPIKAFEQKEGTLFIYINENWEIMSSSMFELFFNTITKGLTTQLKLWQDKNKYRLYQNGFTETYIENVKKITGGDLSREQQYHKVKQYLYNHIKVNIKQIVQHEFVF